MEKHPDLHVQHHHRLHHFPKLQEYVVQNHQQNLELQDQAKEKELLQQ